MTKKKLSRPDPFDYRLDPEDFVFYELGRLIEEDRADLEEPDFRHLIEEGVREHIERRPQIRQELAGLLRARNDKTNAKLIRLIEDPEASLSGLEPVVRSYTAYLFRGLGAGISEPLPLENEARELVQRWQRGEIRRDELTERLHEIGRPAVALLADLLFDSAEDRTAAGTAIELLGAIASPASARVLAHAISETILDEDLELKAYAHVLALWPAPRLFVLYSLRPHTHEDLPYRWFQLLVDAQEPFAADRIIEEIVAHAENPDFSEDLRALLELLPQARDPAKQDKILHVLNTPGMPPRAIQMLEEFLKQT